MKALLIVDLPNDLNKVIQEIRVDVKAHLYGNEIIYWRNQTIKPIPQKMEADYDTITSGEVTEKVVAIGWNACVVAIVGEEENE